MKMMQRFDRKDSSQAVPPALRSGLTADDLQGISAEELFKALSQQYDQKVGE